MYNGEDNAIDLAQGVYKTGAATGSGPFHYSSSAATGYINLRGRYGRIAAHSPSIRLVQGWMATMQAKCALVNRTLTL